MPGIFISYRRSDASGYAGRLYERLAKHFGKQRVFMDIDTLQPGLDFGQALDTAVSGCDVLIALIGPNWLRAADAEGNRRIDNPDDFVRLEIGAALSREAVRVIPVLVGDADQPHANALPDELKPLARRHSVELSDQRWDFDVGRLIARLDPIIPTDKRRIPAPPASPRLLAIGGTAALASIALLIAIGPLHIFGGGSDPTATPVIATAPAPEVAEVMPTDPPTPDSTDSPPTQPPTATATPTDPPTPDSTDPPPTQPPTATATPTEPPTPTPTTGFVSGVDGTAYTSPSFRQSISWNTVTWSVDDEIVHGEGGYDQLVLKADTGKLWITVKSAYQGDAASCLRSVQADYGAQLGVTEWRPALDASGEAMTGASETASWGWFENVYRDPDDPDASPIDYIDYIRCVSFGDGDAVVVFYSYTQRDSYRAHFSEVLAVIDTLELPGEVADLSTESHIPYLPAAAEPQADYVSEMLGYTLNWGDRWALVDTTGQPVSVDPGARSESFVLSLADDDSAQIQVLCMEVLPALSVEMVVNAYSTDSFLRTAFGDDYDLLQTVIKDTHGGSVVLFRRDGVPYVGVLESFLTSTGDQPVMLNLIMTVSATRFDVMRAYIETDRAESMRLNGNPWPVTFDADEVMSMLAQHGVGVQPASASNTALPGTSEGPATPADSASGAPGDLASRIQTVLLANATPESSP